MEILVRRLRETDDRRGFRSGHDDLDRFLHRYAGQNQFRLHIGTTYVAMAGDVIVGYATVASCSIVVQDLPARAVKRLPAYPLPALRLVRMAVAAQRQRTGIGAALMRAVFVLAKEQDRRSGCAFVIVDAKDDALAFYARYGFEAMPIVAGGVDARPSPQPMFLELGAIPRSSDPLPGA